MKIRPLHWFKELGLSDKDWSSSQRRVTKQTRFTVYHTLDDYDEEE